MLGRLCDAGSVRVLSAARRRGEPPSAKPLQLMYAPSRIRTCGLLLRRESLYPAELSGLGHTRQQDTAATSGTAS
jgi:hypothetical protein